MTFEKEGSIYLNQKKIVIMNKLTEGAPKSEIASGNKSTGLSRPDFNPQGFCFRMQKRAFHNQV